MELEHLLVRRDGPVAVVTINRPAVLNALSARTLGELADTVQSLGGDDAVRTIVMTGAGEKSFVAGADIKELAAQTPVSGRELAIRGQAVFDRIASLDKPVIAAVNGFALGGGCELAMACTFRIAAENARFGQPEVNLGLIPGYGGTQRLARLVGAGRALEMLLTGRPISAQEAHRIGLVNRVVPQADLMTEALALASQLAAQPPVAVRYILEAVRRGESTSLAEGQALEATLFGLVAATEDMREGTRAFLDKRTATFTGR